MKKFLSFMLVLAMIASMMCINVSAETMNYVGTHGSQENVNNPIKDGVTGANANVQKQPFTVTASLGTTAIKNRYAVDLTYTTENITISGTSTWNVNTLKYEGSDISVKALNTVPAAQNGTSTPATVKVGAFTMINYSDLAVNVSVAIDVPMAEIAPVEAAVYASAAVLGDDVTDPASARDVLNMTSGVNKEIAGAYNTDGSGSCQQQAYGFTAYVSSQDWAHVLSQLTAKTTQENGGSFTAATFTFTVKPATTYSAD